jgi:hypothetical protein
MALATKAPQPPPDPDLYEADYYAWLMHNAALIRAGRTNEADLAHIAEELEDMGRSERRALASHIGVLLMHLLKWQFQPDHRGSSWRGSIYNSRRAIGKLVAESRSLRGRLHEIVQAEHEDARYNAANETGLSESVFPEFCPYGVDQVLSDGFWPAPPV